MAAIHQPHYLPSFAYLRKMALADVFIFFDDVQLPRGKSPVSRARIKTANSAQWLTLPVLGKSTLPLIMNARIDGQAWARKHWRTLELAYHRAPFFSKYAQGLHEVYCQQCWENLCELDIALTTWLKNVLGLQTKLDRASQLGFQNEGTGIRIRRLLQKAGADVYLTGEGPGTQRYVVEADFAADGIQTEYLRFVHPTYPQLWGEFIPDLSGVDLLFNCGPDSISNLLS